MISAERDLERSRISGSGLRWSFPTTPDRTPKLSSSSGTGGAPSRILVVDDEANIRRLLERFLARLGHIVVTAPAVPEALALLDGEPFDLVLTDLRMPGPSGLDLLAEVRARRPETRTILMSAHADMESAAAAIEQRIDQLIVKPFELEDIRVRVANSLARGSHERERQEEVRRLEKQLRAREADSARLIVEGARSLAAAVEAKDPYTAGHARRVTAYAMVMAAAHGEIDLQRFELAGSLHDVGKIGIPDAVLNKPGRLTAEEFAAVEKHPEIGVQILEPLIQDTLVLNVVRSHHERWDGNGYPQKLIGEQIPLAARILAVADTLDAMSSSRAYRKGLPWSTVVDEIRRCSGTQFDPAVVALFERTLSQLSQLHAESQAEDGAEEQPR